jgi:hypothetical protein
MSDITLYSVDGNTIPAFEPLASALRDIWDARHHGWLATMTDSNEPELDDSTFWDDPEDDDIPDDDEEFDDFDEPDFDDDDNQE